MISSYLKCYVFYKKKFLCCSVFLFLTLRIVTFPVADCILDLPGSLAKIKICQSEWDGGLGVCILICSLFGQGYMWCH